VAPHEQFLLCEEFMRGLPCKTVPMTSESGVTVRQCLGAHSQKELEDWMLEREAEQQGIVATPGAWVQK
jgi:hypothetical protein